jgi:crotonobetainyl-CoA:carnitine CoA-transferase CaiB-like acyl-CoA transferase
MSRLNDFLSGIRVLDLTRHLPGPLATLLLADMGAEVLKIESPRGDELRSLSPRDDRGRPIYFDAVNAGKRARTMDLADAAQHREFLHLVKEYDILVESFRPGVMGRLGLGYPALREVNPGLIYCAMSGYGKNSPLSDAAGHDANYLALAGTLAGTGTRETPLYFTPPVADCTGSLIALASILGALISRGKTGKGCEIDLGLADVTMPLQIFQLAYLGAMGVSPRREAEFLNGGAAYYRIYRTADGRHVALGAVEPKFWEAFCKAANRMDWVPRQADPVPQAALIAELVEFFASMSMETCRERFGPADCCFTPVLELGEAVESPHHKARGLVRRNAAGTYEALFPVLVDGEPPTGRTSLAEESLQE